MNLISQEQTIVKNYEEVINEYKYSLSITKINEDPTIYNTSIFINTKNENNEKEEMYIGRIDIQEDRVNIDVTGESDPTKHYIYIKEFIDSLEEKD